MYRAPVCTPAGKNLSGYAKRVQGYEWKYYSGNHTQRRTGIFYLNVFSLCLFCPIITQEPLYRLASNFKWDTRETHGNFLSLVLCSKFSGSTFYGKNIWNRNSRQRAGKRWTNYNSLGQRWVPIYLYLMKLKGPFWSHTLHIWTTLNFGSVTFSSGYKAAVDQEYACSKEGDPEADQLLGGEIYRSSDGSR